eukprot:scaffold54889_cov39-Attheya_sp.AAC.1
MRNSATSHAILTLDSDKSGQRNVRQRLTSKKCTVALVTPRYKYKKASKEAYPDTDWQLVCWCCADLFSRGSSRSWRVEISPYQTREGYETGIRT